MRIKLTTGVAGIDRENRAYSHDPDDIVDVPNEQAVEWLRGGLAEPVDAVAPPKRRETRIMRAGETR